MKSRYNRARRVFLDGRGGYLTIYLETDRLILRQFTVDDADLLCELDSDPEVTRYTSFGKPTPYEVVRDQILPRYLAYYEQNNGFGYWAAIEKATGAFIGWFHFRPSRDNPEEIELGYRLRKAAWGNGYATEGSRALVAKGFMELGVKRVSANALATNKASIRVMEKVGLKFEKTFFYEGIAEEAVKYSMDKVDYNQAG
jgi:RimJ/RimL family protein N-acetyltransferase